MFVQIAAPPAPRPETVVMAHAPGSQEGRVAAPAPQIVVPAPPSGVATVAAIMAKSPLLVLPIVALTPSPSVATGLVMLANPALPVLEIVVEPVHPVGMLPATTAKLVALAPPTAVFV